MDDSLMKTHCCLEFFHFFPRKPGKNGIPFNVLVNEGYIYVIHLIQTSVSKIVSGPDLISSNEDEAINCYLHVNQLKTLIKEVEHLPTSHTILQKITFLKVWTSALVQQKSSSSSSSSSSNDSESDEVLPEDDILTSSLNTIQLLSILPPATCYVFVWDHGYTHWEVIQWLIANDHYFCVSVRVCTPSWLFLHLTRNSGLLFHNFPSMVDNEVR